MAKSPQILWLVAAQQQLRASLARQLAEIGDDTPYQQRIAKLEDVLRKVLSDWSDAVVVRERLQGYRAKSDLDVLLVEVFPSPDPPKTVAPSDPLAVLDEWTRDPHCYIVKVGEAEEMSAEWQGWKKCRPPGMHGDSVLTMLRPGPKENGHPICLIYGEGHAILGDKNATDLELAFIECCRFGTPSLRSVQQGIQRLFSRLSRRFYTASFVTPPGESLSSARRLLERIQEGLVRWRDSFEEPDTKLVGARRTSAMRRDSDAAAGVAADDERRGFRRITVRALAEQRATFIDPCDYMQFVIDHPRLAARLLCGCSHGDLHGRNILTSRTKDGVGSLCVFDYEDMERDNAVAWDFVKLETELKIRVYPYLFRGTLVDYVKQVHQFEAVLTTRTEMIHDMNTDRQPDAQGQLTRPVVPGNRAGERLARLVLTIRLQAKRHLGQLRLRQRDWLEEYYFILLCYGCAMAKMSSYEQRHLMAGFVAAGVAARRLHYPQHHFDGLVANARREAAKQTEQIQTLREEELEQVVDKVCKGRGRSAISYHACLAFAKVWSRAGHGEPELLKASVAFLERLRPRYPHVLEIEEELVLALLELRDPAYWQRAEEIMEDVDRRYSLAASDEMRSRGGRLYKDKGIALWGSDESRPDQAAIDAFRISRELYRQAYGRRGSYYPAINVASLSYLISAGDAPVIQDDISKAKSAAERYAGPPREEESMWVEATRGEIHFLDGQYADAARLYRSAVRHPRCQPQARQSMLRQLRLLLRIAPEEAKRFWTERRQMDVFGEDACREAVLGETPSHATAETKPKRAKRKRIRRTTKEARRRP